MARAKVLIAGSSAGISSKRSNPHNSNLSSKANGNSETLPSYWKRFLILMSMPNVPF